MLVNFWEGEEMLVFMGFIVIVWLGWGLKEGMIVLLVLNDFDGRLEVFVVQIFVGVVIFGVKMFVLLFGLRFDDLVWSVVGELFGGGNVKVVVQEMCYLKLVMYVLGIGCEYVGKVELVYVLGFSLVELMCFFDEMVVLILIFIDFESEMVKWLFNEVICVVGDMIIFDVEGFEVLVVFDLSGFVYCLV